MEQEELRASISRVVAGGRCYVILVSSGPMPRFAYTIGAIGHVGAEFCLAGALTYSKRAVKQILETAFCAVSDRAALDTLMTAGLEVPGHGHFALAEMDPSWASRLLLAAQDHYGDPSAKGIQLIPDRPHTTIDVPDMSSAFMLESAGPWKWSDEPWPHDSPVTSLVGVDLEALRGRPVLRATRWEVDYFEAFSQPEEDVTEENATVVPLALLVGATPGLSFIADLAIGERAYLRDDGQWDRWISGTE